MTRTSLFMLLSNTLYTLSLYQRLRSHQPSSHSSSATHTKAVLRSQATTPTAPVRLVQVYHRAFNFFT